ncbi:MAG: RNA chaperone Hfq, partial [Firmicutes bacterium]|nr:RNA chaperone Hfq [Bacillota bacterium]
DGLSSRAGEAFDFWMVKGFDNFTVILESDGKQLMVYKHAISTISPLRPVNTSFSENKPV